MAKIGEFMTRYNYSRGEGAVNVKWRKAQKMIILSTKNYTVII